MKLLELQTLYNKYRKWFKRKEENEQIQLIFWLEERGYKYFSVPNSTFTKSIVQHTRNTLMGVSSGVPDMCIVLKRGSLLFIELKRTLEATDYRKDGKIGSKAPKASKEQLEWIEELNKIDNIDARVCFGFEEAKNYVLYCENI